MWLLDEDQVRKQAKLNDIDTRLSKDEMITEIAKKKSLEENGQLLLQDESHMHASTNEGSSRGKKRKLNVHHLPSNLHRSLYICIYNY